MSPLHRRSSVRPLGSTRRRTTWAREIGSATLSTDGAYSTFDLLNTFKTAGGNTQGITIARTHLVIAIQSVPAANDALAYGVIRGQNTDVGLSIAGAPSPNGDLFEDWAFWEYLPMAAQPDGGGYCAAPTGPNDSWRVDIRAKRKLPELQMSWNFVIERVAAVSTDLVVNFSASTLLMLP